MTKTGRGSKDVKSFLKDVRDLRKQAPGHQEKPRRQNKRPTESSLPLGDKPGGSKCVNLREREKGFSYSGERLNRKPLVDIGRRAMNWVSSKTYCT